MPKILIAAHQIASRLALGAVIIVTMLLVSACHQQDQDRVEDRPLTVYDLRLMDNAFAGIDRIEYKSVVVDQGETDAPNALLALRARQIASSAYYKYWLVGGGQYKAKLSVYTSEEAAATGWDGRFPPAALVGTNPVALGDTGFNLNDKTIGWRDGPVLILVSAHSGADDLPAFAAAYAEQIAEQLRQDSQR